MGYEPSVVRKVGEEMAGSGTFSAAGFSDIVKGVEGIKVRKGSQSGRIHGSRCLCVRCGCSSGVAHEKVAWDGFMRAMTKLYLYAKIGMASGARAIPSRLLFLPSLCRIISMVSFKVSTMFF
jgi:hypothetical protein